MLENGLNGVFGRHVLKFATGEQRKGQDLVKRKKELTTSVKGGQSKKKPAVNNLFVVRTCK